MPCDMSGCTCATLCSSGSKSYSRPASWVFFSLYNPPAERERGEIKRDCDEMSVTTLSGTIRKILSDCILIQQPDQSRQQPE